MELPSTIPWSENLGPEHDVVVSCRARLARNLEGFPFVNRAKEKQREEILQLSRSVLLSETMGRRMIWVDLRAATELDRGLLMERHLISKNHAESDGRRAVAISEDETLSIMVNEEDHLRMQVLAPGLRLEDVYHSVDEIDDSIEAHLDYAFSPRWGYLTACPTNVGTGIRFSVMLHLPGLKITQELDRVRRAAKDLHLAVRGYHGEGTESAGDFYQISNQVTLGRGEQDLLARFRSAILPRIIDYERKAREALVERNSTMVEDRVHRALGVLRSARLLGVEETMKLLSRVRLGVCLGRLPEVDMATVNRMFLQIQPAHLQLCTGVTLRGDQEREARARFVRDTLTISS